MTIQRHLFDGHSRVGVKDLETQPVLRWIPPTIGKAGNLVYAEPREESVLRQTVAQVVPRAGTSADKAAGAETLSAVDTALNFDQAREEGLLLGRQEGLQKGLEEGRRLGMEQGREQGLLEGRAQGQKEGHAAAYKKAEAEISQQMQTLKSVMTHLTHAMNEQDYQLEHALLNLSKEIAKHVIQRELMIDSSHIINIARQALATLPPSRDNVRILVNQDDLPLIEQAIADSGEDWRVVGTKLIERGGCRVESDQSAVDFTIGERFKQVLEQIVNRQFGDDAGNAASHLVPAGEDFEAAPEPVPRASRKIDVALAPAKTRLSFAEEASALTSTGSPVLAEHLQDDPEQK
ncbi:MAG: flagellar assembly protein FliH [Pseudohongiella sp.]|nr:flagellar assembly protein FliH [Pseudohongiella sp.]